MMMSRVNSRNIYRSLINVLYVNKQEFSASSWRSNQGDCERLIFSLLFLLETFFAPAIMSIVKLKKHLHLHAKCRFTL